MGTLVAKRACYKQLMQRQIEVGWNGNARHVTPTSLVSEVLAAAYQPRNMQRHVLALQAEGHRLGEIAVLLLELNEGNKALQTGVERLPRC